MCRVVFFFFSSRRRHTRCYRDWSSDVCSSDLRKCAACEINSSVAGSTFSGAWRRGQIGRASCRGKSVDLGGRRIIKKKNKKKKNRGQRKKSDKISGRKVHGTKTKK